MNSVGYLHVVWTLISFRCCVTVFDDAPLLITANIWNRHWHEHIVLFQECCLFRILSDIFAKQTNYSKCILKTVKVGYWRCLCFVSRLSTCFRRVRYDSNVHFGNCRLPRVKKKFAIWNRDGVEIPLSSISEMWKLRYSVGMGKVN